MTPPAMASGSNHLVPEPAPLSDVVTEIAPARGWRTLGIHELWQYRELMSYLALRDIKLRYRQTFFGVAWAVLQPLLTMAIFVVAFGRVRLLGSDRVPYPVFALAGLVGWQLFSSALTQASMSVLNESRLITKVYFPRLLLPVSACGPALLDFTVSLAMFYLVAYFFGQSLRYNALLLPLMAILVVLAALSFGILLSALTIRFRDFRYIIPFVVQFLLFASPVAYSADVITRPHRALYWLNPMVPVLGYVRWALLGLRAPTASEALPAAVLALLALCFGLFYFRRTEASFADVA